MTLLICRHSRELGLYGCQQTAHCFHESVLQASVRSADHRAPPLLLLGTSSLAVATFQPKAVATPAISSLKNQQGSAVKLGDQTIVFIPSRIESFTPEFRTEVISKRNETFAKDLSIPCESLELIKNGDEILRLITSKLGKSFC